jgi:hypothetical protein
MTNASPEPKDDPKRTLRDELAVVMRLVRNVHRTITIMLMAWIVLNLGLFGYIFSEQILSALLYATAWLIPILCCGSAS